MDGVVPVEVLYAALALCGSLAATLGYQLRKEKKNNHNPNNPGHRGCMEGGQMLGEFRAYVLSNAADSREIKDELRGIKELLLERLPRG